MKYPELTEKCKTCTLGCFRLENPEFKGIYRCDYFTGGLENDEKKKCDRN